LNSAYGLPIQGSSADFAPRGIGFRVFGSSEFPNMFEKKQDSQMQAQKKSSQCKHGKLKVLYLLPISNIPNTI
jgi:hypothetical protein